MFLYNKRSVDFYHDFFCFVFREHEGRLGCGGWMADLDNLYVSTHPSHEGLRFWLGAGGGEGS